MKDYTTKKDIQMQETQKKKAHKKLERVVDLAQKQNKEEKKDDKL